MLIRIWQPVLVTVVAFFAIASHARIHRHDGNFVFGDLPGRAPSKPTDHARVARELVHKSQWTPFGTIASYPALKGFPMVSVIAIADSEKDGPSTGIIYFYLTNLDFPGQDLKQQNSITLLFSNDTDLSCTRDSVDPMEPTCSRSIISGKLLKIDENSEEHKFASAAFLSRHPSAEKWIIAGGHGFYLCKLDIESILVLDWYGGPHIIKPDDYYKIVL